MDARRMPWITFSRQLAELGVTDAAALKTWIDRGERELTFAQTYIDVARRVNQIELYREAAVQIGVALPSQPMRSSRLLDGTVWDGTVPAGFAEPVA